MQDSLPLEHLVYLQEDNTNRSLLEVTNNYLRGKWILAPHQREFVWGQRNIKDWIALIKTTARPEGCIVTYQIHDGTPSPVYINDGSQRIRATLQYLQNPELYGDSSEQAERSIDAVNVSCQHRHYPNQIVAVDRFQKLNKGTHLTPLEFNAGRLIYMPGYADTWEPLLRRVNSRMLATQSRVCRQVATERAREHKWQRDVYGTLARFLGEVKEASRIDVANTKKPSGELVEDRLRNALQKLTPVNADTAIRRFESFLDMEVALVEQIWYREMRHNLSNPINTTLFRWILALGVYRRNNQIPESAWEGFLRLLLEKSRGTSDVFAPERPERDGKIPRANVRLNDLSRLRKIQLIIGYDLMAKAPSRTRTQKRIPMKTGNHASHIEPVSVSGDGPVIVEPAYRNLSRGAKAMTAEEIADLSTCNT